jgi:two-component system, LytTR family, response regulator
MKLLRALIIDSDKLAIQQLKTVLKNFNNLKIIGEASNISSAISLIENESPDIIFIDVTMNGDEGLELIDKITFDGELVIVTKCEDYAVKAFEINALDYLIKPVTEERIDLMLSKLNQECDTTRESIIVEKYDYEDRVLITDLKSAKFITINDITAIYAIGNYSKLLLSNGEKHVIYKTLKEWNSRLPYKKFVRIHRSTIVNIEYIERLEKWFNCSFKIYVKGITNPFNVSKGYSGLLKEIFS